jgi:hypothetical protein
MSLDKIIISGIVLLVVGTLTAIVFGSIFHIPMLLEVGKILLWTSLGASLIPLLVVVAYGIYLRTVDRIDRK